MSFVKQIMGLRFGHPLWACTSACVCQPYMTRVGSLNIIIIKSWLWREHTCTLNNADTFPRLTRFISINTYNIILYYVFVCFLTVARSFITSGHSLHWYFNIKFHPIMWFYINMVVATEVDKGYPNVMTCIYSKTSIQRTIFYKQSKLVPNLFNYIIYRIFL